jgi:arsenate reductase
MAKKATIYHNPRCTKSREALALLRAEGIDPEIVEYLKTPPDRATLAELARRLGVHPRAMIRKKEHAALGLKATDDADELLDRMAAHPEIIERPIVVSGRKARIGRPAESVLEIF